MLKYHKPVLVGDMPQPFGQVKEIHSDVPAANNGWHLTQNLNELIKEELLKRKKYINTGFQKEAHTAFDLLGLLPNLLSQNSII